MMSDLSGISGRLASTDYTPFFFLLAKTWRSSREIRIAQPKACRSPVT